MVLLTAPLNPPIAGEPPERLDYFQFTAWKLAYLRLVPPAIRKEE